MKPEEKTTPENTVKNYESTEGLPNVFKSTGLKLVWNERSDHFTKHNRTVESDIQTNSVSDGLYMPLVAGAIALVDPNFKRIPAHWDPLMVEKMMGKTYRERLAIAASLFIAEIDRDISKEEK